MDESIKENNNDENLFVVGGSGITVSDLKITNAKVSYRNLFKKDKKFGFVPTGEKAMAIFLIY